MMQSWDRLTARWAHLGSSGSLRSVQKSGREGVHPTLWSQWMVPVIGPSGRTSWNSCRCCLDQDRRGEKNPRYFVGSALISCVVNDFTSEHTKCLTTPHNLARPIESTEVDSNKLQINFKSLLTPSDPLKSVSKQYNSIQIHLKPIHILANLFNYWNEIEYQLKFFDTQFSFNSNPYNSFQKTFKHSQIFRTDFKSTQIRKY